MLLKLLQKPTTLYHFFLPIFKTFFGLCLPDFYIHLGDKFFGHYTTRHHCRCWFRYKYKGYFDDSPPPHIVTKGYKNADHYNRMMFNIFSFLFHQKYRFNSHIHLIFSHLYRFLFLNRYAFLHLLL